MPNKRIDPEVVQSARITIRFSADEYRRLKLMTKTHGVTMAELIRARTFGTQLKSRVDMQAIRELRRTGGLFKHFLTTLIKNRCEGFDPQKSDEAILLVVKAIHAIAG
jgi:hypothetical protein